MIDATVRRAHPTDAEDLARISVDAWRDTYPLLLPADYLANRLTLPRQLLRWRLRLQHAPHEKILVAVNSTDTVIGYIGFGPCRRTDLRRVGEIYELYVATEHQDSGVGRQLIDTTMEWFCREGVKSVIVEVLVGNPARFFYERMGATIRSYGARRFAGRDLGTVLYGWDETRPRHGK